MSRLEKFRITYSELDIDGMVISDPSNRLYLSGFTGSAGFLVIGKGEAFIITDFRYWEQVGQEVPEASGFTLHRPGPDIWQSIRELILQLGWTKIGFEAGSLSYREYRLLTQDIPEHCRFVPLNDVVERQRWVKDENEITEITRAEQITVQAFLKSLELVKPGIRENELGLEFDYQLRRLGASGNAFPTIIASGWRGAMPHGVASDKPLVMGDLVIFDGGALYNGYHGDLTRTFVIGKATPEQTKIYRIVLEAQQKALEFIRAGIPGNVIDRLARQVIMEHGYGTNFGHGLGHCVGLNIHENPRLSPSDESIIPENATITVEPGIYLADWGGVRIEDLVVVKENGVVNLAQCPKETLLEI